MKNTMIEYTIVDASMQDVVHAWSIDDPVALVTRQAPASACVIDLLNEEYIYILPG